MYVPSHFEESSTKVLHDFMAQNPLGTLFTHGKSGLDANHIPFLLDAAGGELGVLHAHVARANTVWQDVTDGDEVLVVFRAADAYISPGWYPSKNEFHKQVPTWNYIVAHAYSRITIHDDERYVRGLVARLTRTHEASQATPWKMTDSPREYIDAMLKATVGVQVEITRLVGKTKLSQNKEVRDIEGAGQALKSQGQVVMGDAMLQVAVEKSKS